MHKIIESYLRQFVTENGYDALGEAEQFERFVNHSVIAQFFLDSYDMDAVTTSSDDVGIDGVAVILGDELITTAEDAKIYLRSAKPRRSIPARYVFCQAKRTDGFDLGEMLKFGMGVTDLFSESPEVSNDVLAEFLEIHEVVVTNLSNIQDGRPHCNLYYACTGIWNETNGLRQRALDPTIANLNRIGLFHQITYDPLDRETLGKLWIATRAPINATFSVKGTVSLPPINGVTEAYLALAPAQDFINNVLSDEGGRMRTSVFEQNVRAFLGDDNPVNLRIKEALGTNSVHDRFAINNNGVTIVSPDVKVQSDRVSVSDFQIVNGCQTSHVLHRNKELVGPSVWIPIKIIEADDPDIVAQLVESTNSQTMVEQEQFLSIRPFARKIEAYFNAFEGTDEERERRLYFERRTNQYAGQGIGRLRAFDIPKLARVFAAMFLDLPHIAYMYPNQVFVERKEQLFRSDHREHIYYTAALALYRLELALGNQYVTRQYQSYKWHMLMIVRYLYGGPEMPRLDSQKIENYCAKIDSVLVRGGKASAPPFQEAARIIEQIGVVTRDRRKGQKYTDELREAALRTRRSNRPRK
jgi:hypothetical protein